MDDEGQEQAPTLAEATTLANQAITDLNTLITSNGSDTSGATSVTNLQAVKNDIVELENILTQVVQDAQTGA